MIEEGVKARAAELDIICSMGDVLKLCYRLVSFPEGISADTAEKKWKSWIK